MGAFENSAMYRPRRGPRRRGGLSSALAPVLAGVAGGLLIMSLLDPGALAPARSLLVEAIAPVITASARAWQPVARTFGLEPVSPRLGSDAARIADLEMRLADVERENADLKQLARFVRATRSATVSARILMMSASPLAQTVLVNAGRSQGVKGGFPVVAGDGLFGRVLQAHSDHASIMLLSDRQSRVPVAIGPREARAVLVGTGGPQPKLEFLAAAQQIAAGDLVTTSGLGGVYPRGLAVGVVVADGQGVRVELTAGRADPLAVTILMLEAGALEPAESGTGKPERTQRQAAAAGLPVKPQSMQPVSSREPTP